MLAVAPHTRLARIVIVILFAAQAISINAQTGITGYWTGRVAYKGDDLPVEITFDTTPAGLRGVVSAPTLRAYRYPLQNISFDGAGLIFDLSSDGGTFAFKGVLEGDALRGAWNLFGLNATVSMTRGVSPSTQKRRKGASGSRWPANELPEARKPSRSPRPGAITGSVHGRGRPVLSSSTVTIRPGTFRNGRKSVSIVSKWLCVACAAAATHRSFFPWNRDQPEDFERVDRSA